MTDICSVSVVLPYYNAGGTIFRALNSVYNQTLLPFEIIIVDDCSSAENVAKLEEAIKRCKLLTEAIEIKFFRLDKNQGAPSARNVAIENASGRYLAFLDSDDVWHENKISTQFSMMEKNNLSLSAHDYVFDLTVSSFSSGVSICHKIYKWQFIFNNPFFTPTVMARRFKFKKFDTSFRRCDDYKCWLENINAETIYINLELAGGFKKPIGSSGLTGSLSLMHHSYLSVLKSLFSEGKVSGTFYILASTVEYLKYPYRIFRCRFFD